jgi:hypothetical protein
MLPSRERKLCRRKYLHVLENRICDWIEKNAQARRTSSFGIFTSPRPILLASGTGPPTNFEDWISIADVVNIPDKLRHSKRHVIQSSFSFSFNNQRSK